EMWTSAARKLARSKPDEFYPYALGQLNQGEQLKVLGQLVVNQNVRDLSASLDYLEGRLPGQFYPDVIKQIGRVADPAARMELLKTVGVHYLNNVPSAEAGPLAEFIFKEAAAHPDQAKLLPRFWYGLKPGYSSRFHYDEAASDRSTNAIAQHLIDTLPPE